MRIFKFASDLVLKPRQRGLINFFDEYKLKHDKTKKCARIDEHDGAIRPVNKLTTAVAYGVSNQFGRSKANAKTNRKTAAVGATGEYTGNMENLLEDNKSVNRIIQALENFDPDGNEKDKAIYRRIVDDSDEDSNLDTSIVGAGN